MAESAVGGVKVAAVVVTYDRPEDLRSCIDALLAQTHPLSLILILDNAGPLPAESMIGSKDPIKILRLPLNLGGAGGFAVGLEAALKEEVDWIWLLDDDAIAEPDALSNLLADGLSGDALDAPPSVLLSAVYEFGSIAPRHRRRFERFSGWEASLPKSRYREQRVSVDSGSFVGFLVRAEVARSIPLPRADFFLAFDDTDYSLRMLEKGQTLYLVPSSRIDHRRSRGARLREGPFSAKHYLNVRNHLHVKLKHAKLKGVAIALGFFYGLLVWAITQKNLFPQRMGVLIAALKDGLRGRLGPPKSRLLRPSLQEDPGRGLCVLIRTQGKRPELLLEAVDSVLSQEGDIPVRIWLLVHEGPAVSRLIEADLKGRDRSRIEVLTIESCPKSRAHPLNVALQKLYQEDQGPFALSFLDDDDLLEKDFASRLLFALQMSGADLAYAESLGFEIPGASDQGYSPLPAPCLIHQNFMPINSYALRFSSLKRSRVFFEESLEVLEDWNFLHRLLVVGFEFEPVYGVLSQYRLTGDGNRPKKEDQALWDRAWDGVQDDLKLFWPALNGEALFESLAEFDFSKRKDLQDFERVLLSRTIELLKMRYPDVSKRYPLRQLERMVHDTPPA